MHTLSQHLLYAIGLSCSASLTINVTDVNDNPPVFTEDVYKFSVEELFATEMLSIGNVSSSLDNNIKVAFLSTWYH